MNNENISLIVGRLLLASWTASEHHIKFVLKRGLKAFSGMLLLHHCRISCWIAFLYLFFICLFFLHLISISIYRYIDRIDINQSVDIIFWQLIAKTRELGLE